MFLQQGYPGDAAYVVLSGAFEALVKRPGASGDAGGGELVVAATYARGDSFGEASLLVGARRDASLRATADAWVLEVHRRGLETVAARRPAVADEFARFSLRLEKNTDDRRRRLGKNDGIDVEDDEDAEGLDARESTRATPADHDRSVESVSRWIARGERSSPRSASEDGVLRSRLAFGESSRVALDVLSRLDVFASLDRTQMLVMLREGARVETHPPGSVVATRGDERDAMYAILEGEAERADGDDDVESESSSRRILTRGDAFGESCLLDGRTETRDGGGDVPRRDARGDSSRGGGADAPKRQIFHPAAAAAVAAKEDQDDDDERRTDPKRRGNADSRRARRRVHPRVLRPPPRRRRRRRRRRPTKPLAPGYRRATTTRRRSRAGSARVRTPSRPGPNPRPGFVRGSPGNVDWERTLATRRCPRRRSTTRWTARLRAHPLFGAMTACELAHLRVSARRVFVPVGRRLVGEGDEGDDAFVVVAGVLHAYRRREGARGADAGPPPSKTIATETKALPVPVPARVKVGEIGPGFVCGAARAVRPSSGGRRRVVSVVATPPGAEAVAVSGEALRRVLRERPTLENLVDDLEADGTLDVDDGLLRGGS